MLDTKKIKAISLDLDDTLWPIAPVIARAEQALQDWLRPRAPHSAATLSDPGRRLALRQEIQSQRPDIGHDLGTLRREIIRRVLHLANEDTALAEPAYEVFYAERQRVTLYEDALAALGWLSARFPLVAVSNGNADVARVGLGHLFKAGLSAQNMGIGKPDARIFHAAAKAAGVQPGEVLHVGDDAALDVLGALGAGMQTAWLNRRALAWTHKELPHATIGSMTQLCQVLQVNG